MRDASGSLTSLNCEFSIKGKCIEIVLPALFNERYANELHAVKAIFQQDPLVSIDLFFCDRNVPYPQS